MQIIYVWKVFCLNEYKYNWFDQLFIKQSSRVIEMGSNMIFFFFLHQSDSAYNAGDRDGALRNATIAKWLNVASIVCGIIIIIVLATSI